MRVIREYAVWWVVLWVTWVGLASPTAAESALGALAAAAAAAAGVRSRAALAPPTTVPGFAAGLRWLPADVVLDALALTGLLVSGRALRPGCGDADTLRLPGDDPASSRAWGVLVVSASPGSLATDVEDRDGELLLHRHRLTTTGRVAGGLEPA